MNTTIDYVPTHFVDPPFVGMKPQHRKEKHFVAEIIVLDPGKVHDPRFVDGQASVPIIARFYETGERSYCCVWIEGRNETQGYINRRGSGWAGGHGYHRQSSALETALANAGVALYRSCDGCGESAMFDRLRSVGEALGIVAPAIHHSHG